MKNANTPPLPKRALDVASVLLASTFFTSYIPAAFVSSLKNPSAASLQERKWTGAGFVGSLWGVATYLLLPARVAQSAWAVLVAVVFSILVSHRAERVLGNHDDSRIVIDEWAGAWIAVWRLPAAFGWPLLLAFILFRAFDALKGPWGNALQKLPGGVGITMDDVGAGIAANVAVRLVLFLIRQ